MGSWVYLVSYQRILGDLSQGIKLLVHEAGHSYLSGAEVKNVGDILLLASYVFVVYCIIN
jgi:hypothetical protein